MTDTAAERRPKFLSRKEFCRELRMGETKFHALCNAGLIRPVRVGRTVLVPETEITAVIARMSGDAGRGS